MFIILSVMALFCVLIYIERSLYFTRKPMNRSLRVAKLVITGCPAVIASGATIAMWVPRATVFTEFLSSVYFGVCIYLFVELTIVYMGGTSSMLSKLENESFRTSTGPCCCCCLCLPTVEFNSRTTFSYSTKSHRVRTEQITLNVFNLISWTIVRGQLNVASLGSWVMMMPSLLTLFAVWPVSMLYSHVRVQLAHTHILPKFIINQAVLIITTLQSSCFNFAVLFGGIKCDEILPARNKGLILHQHLMILEMFMLALVTRFYYSKAISETTTEDDACKVITPSQQMEKMDV
uniref:Solute carrier family 51 alpha subunit n=1 Tax=Petromyzon marinus TaxID=7757 RepID=S4R9Y1_PETMA